MILKSRMFSEQVRQIQHMLSILSVSYTHLGRVIYAGSFSKVMAPAFRLGFLVFNKSLTGPLTVAKQCTDVHSTVLFQYICNEYINNYDFDKHLEDSRKVYEHKCNPVSYTHLDVYKRQYFISCKICICILKSTGHGKEYAVYEGFGHLYIRKLLSEGVVKL